MGTQSSDSDIEIRQLRLWEIPRLLKFRSEYDYGPSPTSGVSVESVLYSLLKTIWHRKRMSTFVAVSEGEIMGYISMTLGRHKQFKGNVYIVSAAVKESVRGRGIGTLLFNGIEKYTRSIGARRVELEVFGNNTGAIKLYERLGYKKEGVKREAAGRDGNYDDLIMMAKFVNGDR